MMRCHHSNVEDLEVVEVLFTCTVILPSRRSLVGRCCRYGHGGTDCMELRKGFALRSTRRGV